MRFEILFGVMLVVAGIYGGRVFAEGWTVGEVKVRAGHPVVAVTAEEMGRLKAAWKGTGEGREAVAERIGRAEEAMKAGVTEKTFPPEGGHHNQWYQCETCQMGLKTIDATHHQCPKCKTIYSGFPYDNVLYTRIHRDNFSRAEDAAWAYAITGEKKYAEYAAAILTGYADRYLKYPMMVNSVGKKGVDVAALKSTKYKSAGHIDNQTLGEAMLMVPLCNAYDLVYETLSEEQRKHIEGDLIRPMIECIDVNKMGKVNWQTWHDAALLYAGAVMGDEKLVREALLDPENGFEFQMKHCVMAEGMWYENSWGYHNYTLMAMTKMAEGARRLGIDLYSHPNLKKMYLVAFDYQMPDGTLPRFGDMTQAKVGESLCEFGYAAYKDKRLLPALPEKATWDSVLLGRPAGTKATWEAMSGSKLFTGSGHAVLRTDGPGKLTATLTFSPYGGFHTHFDKNSMTLFAFGEELALDPGRAESQAYRLPIHKEWYRATAGHNAVLVDGKGQASADGELIAYEANASYAGVVASAGKAFPEVQHRRMLLLTPTYALVVDELRPADQAEHTYELLYHSRGKSVEAALELTKRALPKVAGFGYLHDVRGYLGGETPAKVVIGPEKDGGVTSHVMLATKAGDELFTATGPFKSVEDRAPVVILRRTGAGVARLVTLIEPTLKDGTGSVEEVKLEEKEGKVRVTVRRKAGEDEVLCEGELGKSVRVIAGAKEVLTMKSAGK